MLRWEGADTVVVDCATLRSFRVDEQLMRLLCGLADWTRADQVQDLDAQDLEHLVRLGVLQLSDPDSDEHVQPGYWGHFDLAMQRLQGAGNRHDSRAGRGDDPPPPAFKPRPDGPIVDLPPAPALPGDLAEVLERRRTVRAYGDRPLRLGEMSALLHHSVRVKSSFRDAALGEGSLRPFPSGGARSELEVYLMANDVTGLDAGVHYYDARSHALVRLHHRDEHQQRLNRWLHGATGEALTGDPQAVLIVTAVFARVLWKYGAIGLPLIYRNVGCLYQTLYLVATALDLAPCAIGAGEEAANARWLGLDPLVESQVGCFLLGAIASPRAGEPR